MGASSAPNPLNQGGFPPWPPSLAAIHGSWAGGKAAMVREAHLKNEDMTRKKLAFSLAYASFFFAQELAI